MVEGTHTSEAVFGLRRPIGRGPRLWAALVQVDDGETIDTGLDDIEGIATMNSGAPADKFPVAESVAGGIITIGAGKYSSASSAVTGVDAYLIVVGVVR